MGEITSADRGYAWGLQTDFQTAKTIAAGALKRIIATDENLVDYQADVKNDDGWATGKNQATQQWLESHDTKVQHSIPGFAQELGKVFYINLSDTVTTPSGGSLSRLHTFKPQDPATSRQGKAVHYAETLGAGWNVDVPSMVGNGFTVKGNALGILTCDFGLEGSGKINENSAVTWAPTSTPTVAELTALHKLFNTQLALVITDAGGATTYGCRYKSFEIAYKQSLLNEAGYKAGCSLFQTSGDNQSGVIKSALEFDKQMLDFKFEVAMASGSPEFTLLKQQKPLDILLTATGGIIEGAIPHKMIFKIPVGYYKTSKPVKNGNVYNFTLEGSGFFDYVTNKLFSIELTTDVVSYASAF